MSTGEKIKLDDAWGMAATFRALFDGYFDRWAIAGSARRRTEFVHDLEHVVIPRTRTVISDDLFRTPVSINSLWDRCDQLVTEGTLSKHVYGDSGLRYGLRFRGLDLAGVRHELYVALIENWGPTLAIRTGPAPFSRFLQQALHERGYRNHDGFVVRCDRCDCKGKKAACRLCEGTGLVPRGRIAVETEEHYFDLAGVEYVRP